MGNALNIEYYFWWRDYCFGLIIHHDAPFHFNGMVSISDEYKFKRLVLNRVGSLSSSKFTTRAIEIPGFRAGFSFHQKCQFSAGFRQPHLLVSIE